jgi:uncharacterized phage protein (TIGR01671 family)
VREIKFRSWSGPWSSGKYRMIYSGDLREEGNAYNFSFDDGILMQYTGLRDKNEKEIYEFDIVYVTSLLAENNTSFRAIVEWGVSGFVIRRISNFTDGFYMYPVIMDLNPMAFSFEVIGNIYENPELLEVSE